VAKRFEVVGVDIYKPLSLEQIKKIKAKTRYLQNRETILAKAKENYNPVDQCCCIGFPAERLKAIAKICKDIAKKDKTFKYRIYNSKFPIYNFILMVFCGPGKEGADLAHKRGTWLVKKAFTDCEYNENGEVSSRKSWGLLYWVNYKSEMEKHQVGEPAKC